MIIDHQADHRLMRRVGALRRHWYWILATACACAAGAWLISISMPKIYRTTTYILVSESKIGDTSREATVQQIAMIPTFVPFLDNDSLISESLKRLHLDQPPYELTVGLFRRRNYLDVRVPKSTRLLELNIEFPDAKLAAELANDMARAAVSFNDQLNATDATATHEFLQKRVDQATGELTRAAKEKLKVQEEGRIEDREKELNILLAEKDKLSTQLQQLRLSLAQDESKSKTLEKALASEPQTIQLKKSITSDRFLEAAAEKLNAGEAPLSVTEESPNKVREELRKDFLDATVSQAAESTGVQVATARLDLVNKEISRLLVLLATLRSRTVGADHNYLLASDAMKNASKEYQAASLTVTAKSQDLKQIAPALVPERPVRPRVLINTLMGFLFGILVFSGLTIGLQSYRDFSRQSALLESVEEEVKVVAVHRS
jgi:succinoglycan biosynthesis transport protein ExoP